MNRLFSKLVNVCDGSAVLAWLLITNLMVWIVCALSSLLGFDGVVTKLLCLPSAPASFILRPWTLLTYMVTQFSVLHLLFNMLWLFWFGKLILITLSGRHIAALYFYGGILGGILYLSYGSFAGTAGILFGSSASVLSVMTGAAIRIPNYRINLFLIGAVKVKWIAMVSILLTFLGVGGGMSGAQTAHIGGIVGGALFMIILKNGKDLSKWMTFKSTRVDQHYRKRSGRKVAKHLRKVNNERARLDELLDKINTTGYSGLTRREKRELESISNNIQRNDK